MNRSSKQIEEDAIDYLKIALKKSKHIHREISEGDREPIWDGHIYFYKNTLKQNIDLVERIPVQVKGKDDYYNRNKGYSIKRNNLEHYLNEGGVLYFVVYLKDETPTVTYASLTPKVIKRILLGKKKKKQNIINISVAMKPLPDNEVELNLVFQNFIQKRKYQRGIIHVDLRSQESLLSSPENFDGEFQFKFIGKEYLDILEAAKSGELDLYYKPRGATIAELLIDEIVDLQLFEGKEMHVQIKGNEKVYQTIFNYRTKNDYTIDFRNGCSINVQENLENILITLKFSFSNVLSKRIDGLEFILELQKNKGIILNDHKLTFNDKSLSEIDFNYLKNCLDAHIRLNEILDKLKISTELDFTNWSQNDYRVSETLYKGIINKELIKLDRTDYNTIQLIKFANIQVLLLLIPENIGTTDYRLYNFSDYDMILIDENKQNFSKYEAVDIEHLLLIDNFDISDYLSSYLSNKIPIENKDLGLLKLINFSDNQCDQNVLQSCLEFAQKLLEMDNSEYNKLNLLQIKKRLNTLTTEDNNYLLSLMNHSKVQIRFAVACILGYKEQANYIFENEFSNNQKECFIKYPIYNLLNL